MSKLDTKKPLPLAIYGFSQALIYGVIWGAGMYFFSWQEIGTSLKTATLYAIGIGSVFGLIMTAIEFFRRKK